MAINVQFSDSTEAVIFAYFSDKQNEEYYPNQGEVDLSDARWQSYYDSQVSFIQSFLPAPVSKQD